jgi:hypothetical protein
MRSCVHQLPWLLSVLLALRHVRNRDALRAYFSRWLIFVSESAADEVLLYLFEAAFDTCREDKPFQRKNLQT